MTPAKIREDLTFFRDHWMPQEKSFNDDQRAAASALIAAAMARADALTPADFELEIMRAMAVSHNGHTSIDTPRFLTALPVRAWWFADGLHVVSVHPKFSELLGARIARIGAYSADEAFLRIAPFISGIPSRVRSLGAFYLTSPEVLRHIGAITDVNDVALELRLPDGSARTVHLGAAPEPDPGRFAADPTYHAYSVLIPDEAGLAGRWLHVLDGVAQRPATYQGFTDVSRAWIGDGGKILYVRSNQVTSVDADALDQKFVFGVLQAAVVAKRPRYVVVDLRMNNGGNFFNTLLFAQALPRLIPRDGKIFVLVSRATFSAALVTAVLIKGSGGDRAMLIGEPMGDGERFWAEPAKLTLPNSKLVVRYSTAMHEWGEACTDLDACYWPAVAFGVSKVSLAPEIRVDVGFAEYAAGRDPVLDAALALAKP